MEFLNEDSELREGWVSIPPVIVSPFSCAVLLSDPYHITQKNLRSLHKVSQGGAGIRIGVIDTGIDRNHPEFATCIESVLDAVNPSRGNGDDGHGHGTHVASTVAGVRSGTAPNSKLIIIRALDETGVGADTWLTRAILMAIECKVDIITMSLGAPTQSQNILNAVTKAYRAGIIVTAATGNDGSNRNSYPANYDDICLAVAAVDRNKSKAAFSNAGTGTDICDYGVDVIAAKMGGGMVGMSGTSMATPNAAGMVANRLSYERHYGIPAKPLPERYKDLADMCEDLGQAGRDRGTGYGMINGDVAFGKPPAGDVPVTDPSPVVDPVAPEPPVNANKLLGYIWQYANGEIVVVNEKNQALVL